MKIKPLVDPEQIQGSENGWVEHHVLELTEDPDLSWTQISLLITSEFARMVAENPEYKFGVLGDSVKQTLRISWERRT